MVREGQELMLTRVSKLPIIGLDNHVLYLYSIIHTRIQYVMNRGYSINKSIIQSSNLAISQSIFILELFI